jgi:3-hydroxyacyl-CoA dehydrogenase
MHKTVVQAHDVAGFIGNGHFIREALFACQQARELSKNKSWPLEQSIEVINRVTQEFLIRPMGIFQLMDYVGIDVCRSIALIMSKYLSDASLHDQWLDAMVAAKAIGRQNPDGTQRNGCFQYEKHAIKGVYSLDAKQYKPVAAMSIEKLIGPMPNGIVTWKALQHDKDKETKLAEYLTNLRQTKGLGVDIAKAFLAKSQEVGNQLVKSGVADKPQDIDTVLQNGFFHMYGSNRAIYSTLK